MREVVAKPAPRVFHFALATAFVVGATVAQLGRQSGVASWHSIWAEDGQVFLTDAWNESFFSVALEPYSGYALFVPRLVAELVSLFPVSEAAWLTAGLASLVVALAALFVYCASRSIIRQPALRGGLALVVVLMPAASFESTANLANLQWYLLFACFWALVSNRKETGPLSARTAVALLVPLSTPVAALLIPSAAWPLVQGWSRRALVPPAVFVLGLAIQGVVVLTAPSSDVGTPFVAEDLPSIFGIRVAGSFLVGDRLLDVGWRLLGDVFVFGAIVVVAGILVALLRGLDRTRQWFATLCIGEALAFFVLPLAVRGTTTIWPPVGDVTLDGSRYFIVPILFLMTGMAVGIDARVEHKPFERLAPWAALVAVWLGSVLLVNYSLPNPRSAGPIWRASLTEARQACQSPSDEVEVPVAPGAPWAALVPCDRR